MYQRRKRLSTGGRDPAAPACGTARIESRRAHMMVRLPQVRGTSSLRLADAAHANARGIVRAAATPSISKHHHESNHVIQ
jgi:hypothetical protein